MLKFLSSSEWEKVPPNTAGFDVVALGKESQEGLAHKFRVPQVEPVAIAHDHHRSSFPGVPQLTSSSCHQRRQLQTFRKFQYFEECLFSEPAR